MLVKMALQARKIVPHPTSSGSAPRLGSVASIKLFVMALTTETALFVQPARLVARAQAREIASHQLLILRQNVAQALIGRTPPRHRRTGAPCRRVARPRCTFQTACV